MGELKIHMKNRFLFLCAVLILLFGLCACKKTENTQISSKVYAPEKISFTAGSACIEGGCVMDDCIYLLGTDDIANAAYGSFHQYSISRLPLNGGAAEKSCPVSRLIQRKMRKMPN